jgi:hypothetical protein
MSGFRCEVVGNRALLGCYAASSGNFLPTLRDNIWVPSSGVRNLDPEDRTDRFSKYSCPLTMGQNGCPETSVRNYRFSLRKTQKSAVLFNATNKATRNGFILHQCQGSPPMTNSELMRALNIRLKQNKKTKLRKHCCTNTWNYVAPGEMCGWKILSAVLKFIVISKRDNCRHCAVH